jgi:hypothetical protein
MSLRNDTPSEQINRENRASRPGQPGNDQAATRQPGNCNETSHEPEQLQRDSEQIS